MTRAWRDALERGFAAFLVVAGIGQVLAVAVWAVGDTGASLGAFARVGWMYFGAFHHVAIELDLAELEVAGSGAAPAATSVTVGVALLSVTVVAGLLLAHAGRAVADRAGGGTVARILRGAMVAPSYALPAFLLASVVEVRTPVRLGAFASGDLHVSLSTWQALAFPFAIAAVAGAAGGLRSALARSHEDRALEWIAATSTGGLRMFVLGVALSLAGLFVAGVVQPDGPAALLTPSTARYYGAVFDRPEVGLVLLGHHVAAGPNEGVWTLVPAMGGCDRVAGSESADLLCYGRFPVGGGAATIADEGGSLVLAGPTRFDTAPPAYLLFLLVPAIATVLGGRRAAERAGASGVGGLAAGAGAGLVFAMFVAVAALLSTVTVGYGSGGGSSAGRVTVGPDVLAGTALSLAWGVVGGTIGAATAGRIGNLRAGSEAASPSPAGTGRR